MDEAAAIERALAEEMTASLLEQLLAGGFRDFERQWVNRMISSLLRSEGRSCVPSSVPSSSTADPNSIQWAVEELGRTLDETAVNWRNAASTVASHSVSSPSTSADSAALFDCRRLIARLVEDKQHGRNESIVVALRRLTRLVRTLGVRFASPLNVPNSIILAVGVCDMGYSIDEILASKRSVSSERLRTSVDSFNEVVVGGLKQVVGSLPQSVTTRPSSETRSRRHPRGPAARPRTGPPAVRRSPGFLLPLELKEARSKMPPSPSPAARIDSWRIPLRQRTKSNEAHSRTAEKKEVAGMDAKWRILLGAEGLFIRGLDGAGEGEAAMRMAREITREVLQQLEGKKESPRQLQLL